jgi:type VI secretion system protein ImpG
MDPRLLQYYERELQHVREMGAEFAQEFPKIASRLGLEGFECADPYVERLLEGFAFLAGRVQLKLDSEFPRFTQHLLEMVYPHYLAPTPSMAVLQFQPDPGGTPPEGFPIRRDNVLRSIIGADEQTSCEYRTAHDVTLFPIEVARADYIGSQAGVTALDLPGNKAARSGIRLRLRTLGELTFDKLALDVLPLYLRGADELPMHLYEQLLSRTVSIVVRPTSRPAPWQVVLDRSQLRPAGFSHESALLPFERRSFDGYRLLHEYFAFPGRFLFIEIAGLHSAIRRCGEREIDVIIPAKQPNPALDNGVDASNFAPFCSPAINLFPKRADRIHLNEFFAELQVIPDRTRPLDFEVYDVRRVVGYGASSEEQEFLPFYAYDDRRGDADRGAYYTIHRTPRLLSSKQRRQGSRSSYIGSEVFLTLVDPEDAPFRHDLKQLAVETLCTNRDLPLHIPVGRGNTDFTLDAGAPVVSIRCVAGPTRPRRSFAEAETAWRIISHLSLNYLSLVDSDAADGAAALRELLRLYGGAGDETAIQKQIDGIKSVSSRPIIRRVSTSDRLAFGRGVEIAVTCEEAAFRGTGIFLVGAVLAQFFRKYVSINSFTETVLKSVERGEIMRWTAAIGLRQTL